MTQPDRFAEIRKRNKKQVFSILAVIVALLIAGVAAFSIHRSQVESQKIAEMTEIGNRLQPKSDWNPIFTPEDPQPQDDLFCNNACYRYERTWETPTPQSVDQLASELRIPMTEHMGLETYRVSDPDGPKAVQLNVTPPDRFNDNWVVSLLIVYS